MEDIMNKSMVIYKATFPNGKSYIGMTRRLLKTRIHEHEYASTKLELYYPFYNAIRKYGKESVKWTILEQCSNVEDLQEREMYWIEKLNTCVNVENSMGYNVVFSGNPHIYKNEDALKLSEINYIKYLHECGKNLNYISNYTGIDVSKIVKIINTDLSSTRFIKKEIVEIIKNEIINTETSPEKLAFKYGCNIVQVLNIFTGVSYKDVSSHLNELIKTKYVDNKNIKNSKLDVDTVISIKIDLSLGYTINEVSFRNNVSFHTIKAIRAFRIHKYVLDNLNTKIDSFKVVKTKKIKVVIYHADFL